MFRKSLIALSLLGVASQGAASTLTVTETIVTPQEITTATELASNDAITLTTAQLSIAGGAVLKLAFSAAPTNAASIDVSSTGDCAGLSYSGATDSGKTLNYTLTSAVTTGCAIHFGDDGDGTTTGDVTAEFDIADVTVAGITVSASFSDIGDGIDPAAAVDLMSKTAADQYSITVAGADAEIDVEEDRKQYTSGTSDDIVITFADAGEAGTVDGATATSVTYAIEGNFSWADDADTDEFDIAGTAVDCVNAGAGALGAVTVGTGDTAPTASLYTVNVASPLDGQTLTCTMTPQTGDDAVALPKDDFDVSGTVAFTDSEAEAGSQPIASTDAGEWTINGASVTVFAVPFGAEVESHSIFVSNAGDTTGAITGSMVWNGNDAVEFDLGNIQAKANKYLNVIDALTAEGEKPAFGRADITFTVNAPSGDITFTAAYNTAEGRANLYMEQQANIHGLSSNASSKAATAATQSTTAATQSTAAASSAGTACANLAAGTDGAGTDAYGTTACP